MPDNVHPLERTAAPMRQEKDTALLNAPLPESGPLPLAVADTADEGKALSLSSQEAALLSAPLPVVDRANLEATRFVDFVLNDAHENYQPVLCEFYHDWQQFNEEHYQERLKVPHLTIANGPPRAFGFFKSLTDYGGRTQITIDARILSGRRRFVKKPWPAEGNVLFVRDILLHETVHQYLAEVGHFDDKENGKHGEAFADVCNRIGRAQGLPRVYTRRRGRQDDGKPLANLWPINVRPAGYYLGHVDPPVQGRPQRPPELRGLAGTFNFFRYLLAAGQTDKLAAILHREASQTVEPVCAAKSAAEKGEVNHLNPTWLTWNNGCVRQLLHAICKRKMVDLMPLLADMLEAAGCGDELLLTHCRLPVRHTRDCWVLNALVRA
jgi:hypothetical protein